MLSQNTFMKTGLLLMIIGSVSCSPFRKQNGDLEQRVTSLERGFEQVKTDLDSRLETMRRHLEDEGECEGIVEDGKCFTVIIMGASKISYFDAKRMCGYDGISKLGNIYTRTQFNNIKNHIILRKAESPLTFINFWTDMTRDIPSGVLRLSNGQTPAYNGVGNWRNSNEWRTDETRRTNVYVSVWTDGLLHFTNPGGYGNVWPTFGWTAALCEREYNR